jgi:hypothetical protein
MWILLIIWIEMVKHISCDVNWLNFIKQKW